MIDLLWGNCVLLNFIQFFNSLVLFFGELSRFKFTIFVGGNCSRLRKFWDFLQVWVEWFILVHFSISWHFFVLLFHSIPFLFCGAVSLPGFKCRIYLKILLWSIKYQLVIPGVQFLDIFLNILIFYIPMHLSLHPISRFYGLSSLFLTESWINKVINYLTDL